MLIVSLGYTCYVKDLINKTNYSRESDIFDWINSFEFSKNVKSLEDNFNIFDNLEKSQLEEDLNSTVYLNNIYAFRLPHENNLDESKIKYERRFKRFMDYKKTDEKYLFIRQINFGRYGVPSEILENNYNDDIYDKLLSKLPKNSLILLISKKKLSLDEKNNISKKFLLLDDVICLEWAIYGNFLRNKIVEMYNQLFDYINNNYNKLDINTMREFISADKIDIIKK